MNKNLLFLLLLIIISIQSIYSSSSSLKNEQNKAYHAIMHIFTENKEELNDETAALLIEATPQKNEADLLTILANKQISLKNEIFYLKIKKIVNINKAINKLLLILGCFTGSFAFYTYESNWQEYYQYYFDQIAFLQSHITGIQNLNNYPSMPPNDLDDPIHGNSYKAINAMMNDLKDPKNLTKIQQKLIDTQTILTQHINNLKYPAIASILSFIAIPIFTLLTDNRKKINREITQKTTEITRINTIINKMLHQ